MQRLSPEVEETPRLDAVIAFGLGVMFVEVAVLFPTLAVWLARVP